MEIRLALGRNEALISQHCSTNGETLGFLVEQCADQKAINQMGGTGGMSSLEAVERSKDEKIRKIYLRRRVEKEESQYKCDSGFNTTRSFNTADRIQARGGNAGIEY